LFDIGRLAVDVPIHRGFVSSGSFHRTPPAAVMRAHRPERMG
jgi:hypothetical protein